MAQPDLWHGLLNAWMSAHPSGLLTSLYGNVDGQSGNPLINMILGKPATNPPGTDPVGTTPGYRQMQNTFGMPTSAPQSYSLYGAQTPLTAMNGNPRRLDADYAFSRPRDGGSIAGGTYQRRKTTT